MQRMTVTEIQESTTPVMVSTDKALAFVKRHDYSETEGLAILAETHIAQGTEPGDPINAQTLLEIMGY